MRTAEARDDVNVPRSAEERGRLAESDEDEREAKQITIHALSIETDRRFEEECCPRAEGEDTLDTRGRSEYHCGQVDRSCGRGAAGTRDVRGAGENGACQGACGVQSNGDKSEVVSEGLGGRCHSLEAHPRHSQSCGWQSYWWCR